MKSISEESHPRSTFELRASTLCSSRHFLLNVIVRPLIFERQSPPSFLPDICFPLCFRIIGAWLCELHCPLSYPFLRWLDPLLSQPCRLLDWVLGGLDLFALYLMLILFGGRGGRYFGFCCVLLVHSCGSLVG